MCPTTTEADVNLHTKLFEEALKHLQGVYVTGGKLWMVIEACIFNNLIMVMKDKTKDNLLEFYGSFCENLCNFVKLYYNTI